MPRNSENLSLDDEFRRLFYPGHIRKRCSTANLLAALSEYLYCAYNTKNLSDLTAEQLKHTNDVVTAWLAAEDQAIRFEEGKVIRPARWSNDAS